jgi:hypothetical protein
LAARLQSLAAPGTLVIGAGTRRLVGSLFELVDLGSHGLKGFTGAQRVWQVLRERAVESRFEALRSDETPLVGRGEELDLMLRRWARAKQGEGQVVLVSAEPGVGKSRLVSGLRESISADPHIRAQCFCAPHREASALHPIIGHLERAAGFEREDSPSGRLEKLKTLLVSSLYQEADLALIAELLSLPQQSASLCALLSYRGSSRPDFGRSALLRASPGCGMIKEVPMRL